MRTLFVLAVLLVGCGGPSFDGEWSGTLTQTAQCSDGVARSRDLFLGIRGIEDGDVVRFVGNGACGTIAASLNGDVAALEPLTCATLQGEGFKYVDSILGGTLELRDDTLVANVALTTILFAPNGSTILCAGPMTGTLNRSE